jgi:hypothetical protein
MDTTMRNSRKPLRKINVAIFLPKVGPEILTWIGLGPIAAIVV